MLKSVEGVILDLSTLVPICHVSKKGYWRDSGNAFTTEIDLFVKDGRYFVHELWNQHDQERKSEHWFERSKDSAVDLMNLAHLEDDKIIQYV